MQTSFRYKTLVLLPLTIALAMAYSGCGGGGGSDSATTDGTTAPGYTFDVTNGDPILSLGGGLYEDPTNGNVLESIGGNDLLNTTTGGINFAASQSAQTKDVDLQQADLQQANDQARAQQISNQFQMSTQASIQLVQLSDRVKQMTKQGQMTTEDRDAVTKAGLTIAGVTPDQVNDAIQRSMNGDTGAADALLDKASQNLGMPSSAALRDKLLPALGYNLN
jgi:hypothetical protein